MNNTNIETEKTDAEYEAEIELIETMFPNAQFTVSIPIEELDDVVTNEPVIMVKQTYTCHCYTNCNRQTEWYSIRGSNITNKYILNELIKQGLKLECDHQFIEFFHKISECQYEIATFS